MTSTKLASEFTKLYNTLDEYITGQFKTINKNRKGKGNIIIDTKELRTNIFTELYFHLDKYKKEINNINDLEAYSKKFIRSNIYWYNSVIWKVSKTNKNEEVITNITDDQLSINTLNDYIENSTVNPVFYDQIDSICNEFEKTLSLYDKGLYNIYINLHLETAKQISAHLNVSLQYGYEVLYQCKQIENNLKQYIINNI